MLSEQPINILLVDDRPENLLALEALLQPLGYHLVKARSGQEALRCVLQYNFAVILLDVQMPNMDGFETAELIRGRDRSRSTPIIFLTAVSTSELHIAKGYLAGAVDYLLKPFLPEILLAKVAIFVELYAKTAEVRQQAKQLQATIGTLEHEIAERERVEADLRQARDELEQRVRERTVGLAEANQALRTEIAERKRLEAQLIQSQKMESIGRLAGGIAHDFNNLLMAISGYAELVTDSLPAEHTAQDDLHEIRKAAGRAGGLTRQLLTFARKQIMDPRVLDLSDVVRDVDKLLDRLIGEDIEITVALAADLRYVRVDIGQIEQLLINLAVNARDAMPNGGWLTMNVENVLLDEEDVGVADAELAPGYYLRLTVSDTGTGMDAQTQAHLFEPFFTTKETGQGTGLGLATCYGVVKQHAGHITCRSEIGKGTTFDIYLPCVDEAPDHRPACVEPPDLPRGDERLLLVEDEATVRALVARTLRELGYTIIELSNGEEALQYVESHPRERFDLLLTDVVMPRLGGEQLAEQLTADDPALKVLFMSGYTNSAKLTQSRLQAQQLILTKPFAPSLLARQLRAALDSWVTTMPTTSQVNILLVDDRAENLLALGAMLEPLGQNLVKAQSGEDALKYLLRQDFAVILLDVQMPGMDGFETAELIRGRDRSKHTPIIFLTAINTSDTHVSRGYQVGAVDFLLKPIVPDILISKVAVFVELGQKADKIERQADELEVTIHALERQIDERVRTEAALRQVRDQLEQRVRERTDGLAQANQALRAEIAERERAERALRFLAEASSVLAEAIEYEERLAHVAQLAVPVIADWCVIDVLEDSGSLRRVAGAAVDQAKAVLAHEIQRRYPFDPEAPHGAPKVLRTRLPELCAEVTDALLIAAAHDPQHLGLLRALGLTSFISVPLEARGRILGALTIAMSESDRRYISADLPLAEDLAHRIAAAIDNAQLYRAAQDSIRMRDIFLSVAAHELRTPLTSLLGYTQLVERRAGRASTISDRDRQALRVVADQATRLSKMVASLLDISRLQLGQLSIEPLPLDLGALAARLVEEARPLLMEHSIEYIGIRAPALISGDELRLEQALQNLIQNAVKYSPQGGEIIVRVACDDTCASVAVTDSGIGIPPEALSQLFERFYRAPNVDPQHISGLGVGLYVVKEIVELHGGTVDVRSEVGVGSTFMLSIPLLAQPAGII